MENGPFLNGLPINKWWLSIVMLNYQRVPVVLLPSTELQLLIID